MSDNKKLYFIHFEYESNQKRKTFYSNIIHHDLTKEGDVEEIARKIIHKNDYEVNSYSVTIKVISFNNITV